MTALTNQCLTTFPGCAQRADLLVGECGGGPEATGGDAGARRQRGHPPAAAAAAERGADAEAARRLGAARPGGDQAPQARALDHRARAPAGRAARVARARGPLAAQLRLAVPDALLLRSQGEWRAHISSQQKKKKGIKLISFFFLLSVLF